MTRRLVPFFLAAVSLFGQTSKQAVVGSQHDLTASGSGPVKSTVADTCLFCHASHNSLGNVTPLWDQTLSSLIYTTYTSSTYGSGPQTPGAGSSKLCLSCHDGSVAVGLTPAKGTIPTSGTMRSNDVLGANLGTGHPVSMTAANDGQLATSLFATPATTNDPAVKLVGGKTECTTCHDPHVQNNDPAVPMFLVRSNRSGAMCAACHDSTRPQPNQLAGWAAGSHATATNTVPTSASFGPYGTVGADACSSCHGAHLNPVATRNLKASEEGVCTPCHGGANASPALRNISAEFTKTYNHPTGTVSGVHEASESIPVNSSRHAECADCHNSHSAYAQTGTALPPGIQASMTGVSGYGTTGVKKPATWEFEVCFKCHADSTNKPLTSTYGRTPVRYPPGPLPVTYTPNPPLPADQYNLRLKFTSVIGHNVTGNSVATTSNRSLRPFMLNVDGTTNNATRPLTAASLLYCSDCHNNDQARSSNGTGPNGAHGSIYPHMLERNLCQDSLGSTQGACGGTTGAALCGKCHNLTTVRGISPHDNHTNESCSSCHDPHGVIGGNVSANHAMINLDTGLARASGGFLGHYWVNANTKGCYLTCHGTTHNPRPY